MLENEISNDTAEIKFNELLTQRGCFLRGYFVYIDRGKMLMVVGCQLFGLPAKPFL